ncbi:MAG: sporulation protein YqfD [Firmicutes bacterium]|nr:sporulation protein YqfD [Bacillota bacterium]
MLLDRLWPYLKGYVIIKIKGRAQEKCINLACSRGIDLWDIEKIGDRFIVAKIDARDLADMDPILERVGCEAEIIKEAGLPFVLGRLWSRKAFVMGAVIFGIALNVLSSFVWFIEVKGEKEVPEQRILQVVAKEGVIPGKLKRTIDLRRIEKSILAQVREVAWAGAHLSGTKLVIEIAEKKLVPHDNMLTHVVARRDGLIETMITLAGIPVVRPGDTVKRGDVLIKGCAMRRLATGHKDGEDIQIVDGHGIVRARVWYEGTKTVKLRWESLIPTGRRSGGAVALFFGRPIVLGRPPADFRDYKEERERVRFSFGPGGLKIPVEIEKLTWVEVRRTKEEKSYEEAAAEALHGALEALNREIPKGVTTVFKRELVSQDSDKGTVTARIVAEVIEDIGSPRRFSITESDFIVEPQESGADESKEQGKERVDGETL